MRVESRGAVRAYDAKVLEPVIIGDTIDVVEDQGHRTIPPLLGLAAEFAFGTLDASCKQPVLQLSSTVGRVFDEDVL
jgi:hypothetical protein